MKKRRRFTPEQLVLLKSNPYTLSLKESSITFTEGFYQKATAMFENGYSASAILSMLGYDTAILGADRANFVRRKLLCRIGAACSTTSESKTEVVCDERLRAENIMLKQQLEFLKKAISRRTGQESGE